MAKYMLEMELRSVFLAEVNADNEQSAMSIAMEKPELWCNQKPYDQAYGVRSVLEDISDEEEKDE